MKKWLFVILILLIVLAGFIYFYIPNTIRIGSTITFAVNPDAFRRSIMDENNWTKWWPGEKKSGDFILDECRYTIIDKKFNALLIGISTTNLTDSSLLNIIHAGSDSVKIWWESEITTSS